MKIISIKKNLIGGTEVENMIETYRYNNTPSKNLNMALSKLDPPLEYVSIIGDGNCFFTAIAKTINPNLDDNEAVDKGLEYRNMLSTIDINFVNKYLYVKGSISAEEILDEIQLEIEPNIWVETEYTVKTMAILLKINLIIWYNLKGTIVNNYNYGTTDINLVIEEYPPLIDLPNEIQQAIRQSNYYYQETTNHYSATKKSDIYKENKTGKQFRLIGKTDKNGIQTLYTLEDDNNQKVIVDKIKLDKKFKKIISINSYNLEDIKDELSSIKLDLDESKKNIDELSPSNKKKILVSLF